MKDTAYITCNARGAVRMTKRRPDLHAGEVAVQILLEVHDSAFRTPFATAEVVVDEQHAIRPYAQVQVAEPTYDPHPFLGDGAGCEVCGEGRVHYYHDAASDDDDLESEGS